MTQYTISKDGSRIAFSKSGQGQAIILVDGALSYRAFGQTPPLSQNLPQHFTVYTYDRRGRGESTDTRPYSVEREIEDVEALIDDIGGAVYLYGNAYGAVLALRVAIQLGETKVTKLVLFEPPLTLDADAEQNDRESAKLIDELLGANKRSELLTLYLSDKLAPGIVTHMKKRPEWQYMEGVAHTLAYDNAVMSNCSKLVQAAKAATMPVLLLNNSEVPPYVREANEALAQTIPQAQHITLEDIWSHELEDGSLAGVDDSILIEFFNNQSAKPKL